MEPEKLIACCLAKPEAYVDYPFGEEPACFRLRGRIFAELYTQPGNYKITLKCEPMLADFYRAQYPGVVVRGYHCPPSQQPHRNTVWVEQMEASVLLEMIAHSYEQVKKALPKKVRLELDGENSTPPCIAERNANE